MYNEKKELINLDQEKKVFDIKNESYKNDFAIKLTKNGLGDEIKYTLKNPIKITKWKSFKINFKNFVNLILDIL